MLALDRRKEILNIIKKERSVKVPDLSKMFEVTEETIRRDLEKLENEGHIKRTYGGAVLNESTNADPPFMVRATTNIEGKKKIGQKVAEYIEDGDTIMLDSSSTALQVAKSIKGKNNITVITNSAKVVFELGNAKNCTVISTGGTLKQSSLSFVGHWAEEAVSHYYVNKAILACKGLHREKGIMEPNEMEAEVKKKMIQSAEKVFLVSDYTKFDKTSFIKMMDFDKVNVVFTDQTLSKEWEEFLEGYEIELIYG